MEIDSTIVRIHHQDNGPTWFGPKPGFPPAYRFDAPGGEYRTMYAAEEIDGAFVETILHGKTDKQIVAKEFVDQRAWTVIAVRRPLMLMKLYDDGLFWHRTDASVSAANDYTESRRVALAAFQEHRTLDGVTYRSRHDNGKRCFALFDRIATGEFEPGPRRLFRDNASKRDELVAKYGAVYDASTPVLLS